MNFIETKPSKGKEFYSKLDDTMKDEKEGAEKEGAGEDTEYSYLWSVPSKVFDVLHDPSHGQLLVQNAIVTSCITAALSRYQETKSSRKQNEE